VPTIAESGLAGYAVDSWQGVFAPAKTPGEIVQQISRDLAKALTEPSLIDKLARNAYTVGSSSPNELANFLKTDTEKWEAVIRTTGIRID
jgi:tripartite-type tricarboxylate transporter receptor subunit TctC